MYVRYPRNVRYQVPWGGVGLTLFNTKEVIVFPTYKMASETPKWFIMGCNPVPRTKATKRLLLTETIQARVDENFEPPCLKFPIDEWLKIILYL